MAAVEFEQRLEVDIPDTVGIGDHEGLPLQPVPKPQKATARHRRQARIDDGDLPIQRARRAKRHGAIAESDCKIGCRQVEALEIALDHQALVATGYNEIPVPEMAVYVHDVENDGLAANLDHWFRNAVRFLGQARAETAS